MGRFPRCTCTSGLWSRARAWRHPGARPGGEDPYRADPGRRQDTGPRPPSLAGTQNCWRRRCRAYDPGRAWLAPRCWQFFRWTPGARHQSPSRPRGARRVSSSTFTSRWLDWEPENSPKRPRDAGAKSAERASRTFRTSLEPAFSRIFGSLRAVPFASLCSRFDAVATWLEEHRPDLIAALADWQGNPDPDREGPQHHPRGAQGGCGSGVSRRAGPGGFRASARCPCGPDLVPGPRRRALDRGRRRGRRRAPTGGRNPARSAPLRGDDPWTNGRGGCARGVCDLGEGSAGDARLAASQRAQPRCIGWDHCGLRERKTENEDHPHAE